MTGIRRIVGIDCATDPRRTGVVGLALETDRVRVTHAALGDRERSVGALADEAAGDGPALFCLDAPLGWPARLGGTLAPHRAGDGLSLPDSDRLFRRATDEVVRMQLGKQPLEVGADRIARTAVTALTLVEELRGRRDEALPMAWSPQLAGSAVIEVYPAAVLLTRGLPALRYKPVSARALRERILDGLTGDLDAGEHRLTLLAKADVLDAALAALAGVDFLRGECLAPPDRELAAKEGWIWIRGPGSG